MPDYDSKHQQWYDAYKALVFAEHLVREITDDSLHSREICTLLQSAQYLAQNRTVVVQNNTVDTSLVNSEDTINPEELDELFDTVLQED